MSSTAQSETTQSAKGLDVWYKNKCDYCSQDLFLSKEKPEKLYTHTYCYWLDMIKFGVQYDSDELCAREPYSLCDEIRLEVVYNIPKGSLAKFKTTGEYCVFVK
jgi:hypothetical protein